MKIRILGILPFILFALAGCQNDSKKIKIEDISFEETKDTNKLAAVDFVEDYLNMYYDSSSMQERNDSWDSQVLHYNQATFLTNGLSKKKLLYNPPKSLGVRIDKEGNYFLNILLSYDSKPEKIMELKMRKDPFGHFYFIDQLSENIQQYNKYVVDGYTFYYSPKSKRDTVAENKGIAYGKDLAAYFNQPIKKFRVIICQNIKDYSRLQGYHYLNSFNLDFQHGGLSLTEESLFFSFDGSPYYPHEMVHLYTNQFKRFPWFNEGIATYLGGSVGESLDYHLQKIADNIDDFDFSKIPENKRVDNLTTYKYAIGGLFIKLANEEYGGKETVFKLMNAGKKEKDFFKAIKDVFGVDKENLDAFIKSKIKQYYLDDSKNRLDSMPEENATADSI